MTKPILAKDVNGKAQLALECPECGCETWIDDTPRNRARKTIRCGETDSSHEHCGEKFAVDFSEPLYSYEDLESMSEEDVNAYFADSN